MLTFRSPRHYESGCRLAERKNKKNKTALKDGVRDVLVMFQL